MGFARGLTFLEALDTAKVLAARYPDHPSAQWAVADRYIHTAPLYGVPIKGALPHIDRLEVVAPNHADNALHRAMVGLVTEDTLVMREGLSSLRVRATADGAARYWGRSDAPFDLVEDLETLRSGLKWAREAPSVSWLPFVIGRVGITPAESMTLLDAAAGLPELADLQSQLRANRATWSAARGDVAEATRLAAPLEVSAAPGAVRLLSARLAVLGSWLGAVPVDVAEGALARARGRLTQLSSYDRAELAWHDGLIAIVRGDSGRMERAAAQGVATDTTRTVATMPRSLRALWRERRLGLADSLRAIGRALTRAGDGAGAERYLQWTDAMNTGIRTTQAIFGFCGLTAYERGLAAETSGDVDGAVRFLGTFIREVDLPGAAFESQVADAKSRLARLTARDR